MAVNGGLGIEFILLYTFIRYGPVLSKNDHQVVGVATAVTCLYRICRKHGTITAYIEITVKKTEPQTRNSQTPPPSLPAVQAFRELSEKVQFPSRPGGVLLCDCPRERWSNNPTREGRSPSWDTTLWDTTLCPLRGASRRRRPASVGKPHHSSPALLLFFLFFWSEKYQSDLWNQGAGGCMLLRLPGETEKARPLSPYLFICGREGDREGRTAAKAAEYWCCCCSFGPPAVNHNAGVSAAQTCPAPSRRLSGFSLT